MTTEKYQELLVKYLKGGCTSEEVIMLDAWYKSLGESIISEESDVVSEEYKKQLVERNWASLQSKIQEKPIEVKTYQIKRYWVAAASIIFVISMIGLWFNISNSVSTQTDLVISADQVAPAKTIVKQNSGNETIRIELNDKSIVLLQPKGVLSYNEKFDGDNREVTLEGEAFFEITKNPQRPFIVYSNNLVTQVLGTSFNVKSNKLTGNVSVDVRSGKVSVFSKLNRYKEKGKIILTPNQRVDYIGSDDQLIKSIVEKPIVLITNEEFKKFTFKDDPIEKVFDAIEKSYGVEIQYDKDVMKDCRITTSLDDESLFDKISIICKLLGATYKIIGTQIVIEGVTCM
jgi:ferric-dicitrate binding protein FerR (iron transport regulator)